jgi:glycerol kinase
LGAALLAGIGAGVYASPQEVGSIWHLDRAFEPCMSRDEAGARLAQWDKAVRQVLAE